MMFPAPVQSGLPARTAPIAVAAMVFVITSYSIHYTKLYDFVMFSLPGREDVERVNEGLLRRGVIIRPLGGFGLPRCMRVTAGTPEENTIAATAIGAVLAGRPD